MLENDIACYCKGKPEPTLRLELQRIIETLTAPGKGLLACDESPTGLEHRFCDIDVENSESARRDYREMLLSTDKLSRYISGVILHDETIRQRTSRNVEFVEFLRRRNIVAGVKVDLGLVPLFGTEDEKTTQGLDELREKCARYKQAGCHFTKWRCVFSISEKCPSHLAMITNANVLARYASICQGARMVPIVEPDILTTGDYDINRALRAHQQVLSILFRVLNEHHVYLEGMLLKPAMVLPGITGTKKYTPQVVARYTLSVLRRTVPVAIPAIFFLSGGQTDEESATNLNAINTHDVDKKPWRLSFCYGRALQVHLHYAISLFFFAVRHFHLYNTCRKSAEFIFFAYFAPLVALLGVVYFIFEKV
ncbi:Fructose-bisphosphate aldolase [Harpegnathos saltator]|uniref:fructose-bisphosphate aldolase n=1 Tax=Harpegnathos saltator TaxID=610380 RepID=E2BI89_HARSA|nr:Fructose-bisphosphate aldolase [Harpegnathos saltator]